MRPPFPNPALDPPHSAASSSSELLQSSWTAPNYVDAKQRAQMTLRKSSTKHAWEKTELKKSSKKPRAKAQRKLKKAQKKLKKKAPKLEKSSNKAQKTPKVLESFSTSLTCTSLSHWA